MRLLHRSFTRTSAPSKLEVQSRIPLREYIHASLYQRADGYFCAQQPVLSKADGSTGSYEERVHAAHQGRHGWMTPVERFSPFFAHAVAKRVGNDDDGHVVEIGGGKGTLMRDMMGYWDELGVRKRATMVEISQRMAQTQRDCVRQWRHQVHVVNEDATDWLAKWDGHRGHLLAMEVLDNLAHDLIRFQDDGSMQQAYISGDGLEWGSVDELAGAAMTQFELDRRPDSWWSLPSFLGRMQQLVDGHSLVYVPTKLYELLCALRGRKWRVTMADYARFGGGVAGRNAPVVQRVRDGKATTWDYVWQAPFGKVDIMFPTDFDMLARACESMEVGRARWVRQREFVDVFGEEDGDGDGVDKVDKVGEEVRWAMKREFVNAGVLLVDQQ